METGALNINSLNQEVIDLSALQNFFKERRKKRQPRAKTSFRLDLIHFRNYSYHPAYCVNVSNNGLCVATQAPSQEFEEDQIYQIKLRGLDEAPEAFISVKLVYKSSPKQSNYTLLGLKLWTTPLELFPFFAKFQKTHPRRQKVLFGNGSKL